MPNLVVRLLNNEQISPQELYAILAVSGKAGGLGKSFQAATRHPLIKAAFTCGGDAKGNSTATVTNAAALLAAATAFRDGANGISANPGKAALLFGLLLNAPKAANDTNDYTALVLQALESLYRNEPALKKDSTEVLSALTARRQTIAEAQGKRLAEERVAAKAKEAQRIADAAAEAKRIAAAAAEAEAKKPENVVNRFLNDMVASTQGKKQITYIKHLQEKFFSDNIGKLAPDSQAYLLARMEQVQAAGCKNVVDARFNEIRDTRNPFRQFLLNKPQSNTDTWGRLLNKVRAAVNPGPAHTHQQDRRP